MTLDRISKKKKVIYRFNVSAWIFEARQTPYPIFLHFVELTVYEVQYSYHFDLARSIKNFALIYSITIFEQQIYYINLDL